MENKCPKKEYVKQTNNLIMSIILRNVDSLCELASLHKSIKRDNYEISEEYIDFIESADRLRETAYKLTENDGVDIDSLSIYIVKKDGHSMQKYYINESSTIDCTGAISLSFVPNINNVTFISVEYLVSLFKDHILERLVNFDREYLIKQLDMYSDSVNKDLKFSTHKINFKTNELEGRQDFELRFLLVKEDEKCEEDRKKENCCQKGK